MSLTVQGGDGALFHQLQKLSFPCPPVTLIPSGRGNALARDLRRFRSPVAIDLFEVDIQTPAGAVYTRLCASSLSFGYPTSVTRRAEHFRPLGRFSYAAASAFTLPRRAVYEIQYDEQPPKTKELTGVLINNTRHVGGFVAFERASCSDGLLDVMELRAGFLSQMAHNLAAMARLRFWRPAFFLQVREARIKPREPLPVMLDGEVLPPAASIHLRIRPAALTITISRRVAADLPPFASE